jgi:4-aminobutyrate aminotransferase
LLITEFLILMSRGYSLALGGAGSRIDMAVGAKIIDVINQKKLLTNAATKGEALKKGLNEMVGRNGIVDVRGIGLMIGIEFDLRKKRQEVKRVV